MADARPASELILIRHAPAQTGGRLCGRRDVPALIEPGRALDRLRARLANVEQRVSSPARRCLQTAAALWPTAGAPETDVRLWEQDFGEWENIAASALPDLGTLSLPELAAHRPPGGESFDDLCARVAPALDDLSHRTADGPVAVIAHAGTVRAALARAMRAHGAALAFEIPTLSETRLRCLGGGSFSVICVNCSHP